ncbi:SPFH domain-containing protein [Rhodoferax sp. 4810]|nr:SPFH domain-containing protein [Rhodoferax jenense]
MAFFGKKSEGGVLDVIRCDEPDYMIWKWAPNGIPTTTNKENAIRWGSSLRVKDGEVAVFVYKQKDGTMQDFIEGPFDETIKTHNFPVISNIIGLAYAGQSPFQAEVYFINLAGMQKMPIGVPWFDVFDNRFLDFPVKMAARGSLMFNITDYKALIKKTRLINFDSRQFRDAVRDAVNRSIIDVITNAPANEGVPVLNIASKIGLINNLVKPVVTQAFEDDFGVNLVRLDISAVEVDKTTEEYKQLRSITADLEIQTRQVQAAATVQNIKDTQAINAVNMSQSLRIQREQAEKFQALQTETQYLAAHQINKQADVLMKAAGSLGSMSAMGGSGDGGGGGGFNPAGMMVGMSLGGAMGGQMANMMNTTAQNIQQAPPPPPQVQYSVSVNGVTTGPFNGPKLQEMALNGQLTQTTYVWKPGMAGWEHAGNVADLAAVFAAVAPPPPAPPPPPPPPTAA